MHWQGADDFSFGEKIFLAWELAGNDGEQVHPMPTDEIQRVTILAFMQCQWFRNPDKVRRLMDSCSDPERFRRRMIAYALFAGCKSGRVLKKVFGEELCERIIWEEASREIGGQSSACFPADIAHIKARIEQEQPDMIISFGKIASSGVEAALRQIPGLWSHIHAPHPAARHPSVMAELDEAKFGIDYLLATTSAA